MKVDAISINAGFITSGSYASKQANKLNSSTNVIDQAREVMKKKAQAELGAIYEKTGADDTKKVSNATYSINRMSADDRKALVSKMQQDLETRQNQMVDIVSKMMGKQAEAYGKTDANMWQFLAKGDFTVDAATKAQAEKDIAEDGYWGVKQTSERLFDFASALAGDDEEKMKTMQNAMEKGFKKATATWGRELPQISQDTMAAANKLFDNYFASKQVATEE